MEIPLPILTAITGALVTGCFTLFTLLLVERRKRRAEASLKHLHRQIEELYGPLYGLIQFGKVINEIEGERLPKESRDEKGWPRDEEGGRALQFFREHYYLPLNQQMMELIRTKVYLLRSDSIPDSFAKFVRHAAQLDCYHQLWKEAKIRSHDVAPIDFPEEFRSEVENTLNGLRREYNEFIRRLNEGAPA